MYLWKCWRDTRSFFIAFLIIGAAAIPVTAVVCRGTGLMRDFGTEAVRSTFGLLMTIIALGLGAIGAIHEFADKAVHFLFTKPRSRAYFVWAGWAVGCLEITAIALVNVSAGATTLALYSKGSFWLSFFHALRGLETIEILIYGLVYYGMTYSLTAVLRSGLKGLGASMAIMTGYWNLAAVFHWLWHIEMPMPAERIGNLPMVTSAGLWVLLALLFVAWAQGVIERAEV
jgi:ABC-type transport system involved in multi-copper enzyme maturation permease subunit